MKKLFKLVLATILLASVGYAQEYPTQVITREKNASFEDSNVYVSDRLTVGGNIVHSGTLTTDTINEATAGAGVTVDGVLLKDGEVQNQLYVTTTGSSSAYVATLPEAPPAYVQGMSIRVKWNHTNDAAATIDVNSLGSKNISFSDGAGLPAGYLIQDEYATLIYDTTLGEFVVADYTTDWVSFTPTYSADASLTVNGTPTTTTGQYRIEGGLIYFHVVASIELTGGGGADDWVGVSLPVLTAAADGAMVIGSTSQGADPTTVLGFIRNSLDISRCYKFDRSNWTTGTFTLRLSGVYSPN